MGGANNSDVAVPISDNTNKGQFSACAHTAHAKREILFFAAVVLW
jgi:hypothetical protein